MSRGPSQRKSEERAGKSAAKQGAKQADKLPAAKLTSQAIQRGLTASLLAWLLPGAGHWMLGVRRRAAVFFALVLGTVGLGLACDGNLALVDKERAPFLSSLQVAGNLSMGPIEPVIRYVLYGALIYRSVPASARGVTPGQRQALEGRRQRSFRPASAYGTAYLMAAGLMNLLLVLDAWDIGIGRRR